MGPNVTSDLTASVRNALASAGNRERAIKQQAYMKSAMPYRGVLIPDVRRLAKTAVRHHRLRSQQELIAAVEDLWDNAQYREERYAALTLLHLPPHQPWRDLTLLPLYQHMVVTGRWWDLVDDVATHAIGELLRAHRAQVAPVIRAWASNEDLWLRRAALVCQVGAKAETDPALLADIITATVVERDFFVRKGIGWALRDYAETNPDWVRAFVSEHSEQLSSLSVREATKHLR